jgi:hypothetical protein
VVEAVEDGRLAQAAAMRPPSTHAGERDSARGRVAAALTSKRAVLRAAFHARAAGAPVLSLRDAVTFLGQQLPELTLQHLRTLLCQLRRWDMDGAQAISFAGLCRSMGAARLVVTPSHEEIREQQQQEEEETLRRGGDDGAVKRTDAEEDEAAERRRVLTAVRALAAEDPSTERAWRRATAAAAEAAEAAEDQLLECWELLDCEDASAPQTNANHRTLFAALRTLYELLGRRAEQAEQGERLLRSATGPDGQPLRGVGVVGALEGGRMQTARVRRGLSACEPGAAIAAAAACEAELAVLRSTLDGAEAPTRALEHCDRAVAAFATAEKEGGPSAGGSARIKTHVEMRRLRALLLARAGRLPEAEAEYTAAEALSVSKPQRLMDAEWETRPSQS